METTTQVNRKRNYMNAGKKLLIVLFSLSLAFGASAQRGGHFVGGGFHGGGYYPRTYVGVGFGVGYGFGLGYGFGYNPFFPYYGVYGPYGAFPPYYYGYGAMPSRLALQIDDIKNDYKAQIKETRKDKSVPRKERKERIDQLEHDRDAAIIQARKDYYYNSRRNNNNNQPQQYNGNGNGQQPQNGNGQQPGNGNNQPPANSNGGDQPEYQPHGSTGTGS
jgi:hypothetical protein